MAKSILKDVAQTQISKGISSGIIVVSEFWITPILYIYCNPKDQNEFLQKGIKNRIRNYFINKKVYRKTEACFSDFNKKIFPEIAGSKYYELRNAYQNKDKVLLMNLLSVPLYYVSNFFLFFNFFIKLEY